ncbi:uncharacterized protein LOC120843464 [Ixodes scapularis]|uniref:uncharacterized protein LOC120843464 n=1 Tax=Ixodes scapularis TaxID=6945 RepID=UPI001C392C38|nr:uncharacterized protein LOC120843464 [Ixodes scapularis]
MKLALLQRFRYTKEGYRERFREAKPGDGETRKQFAARLTGYFDRWIEVAGVEKAFEALRDRMLMEQFMTTCASKLMVFLKEKHCLTLDDLAEKADVFLEAQTQPSALKAKVEGQDPKTSAGTVPKAFREDTRRILRCFLCNKVGHKAENCKGRNQQYKQSTCWHCGRMGHKADRCTMRAGDTPQASCLWTASDEMAGEPDETYLTLKNGDKIPVVNAAVGRPPKFLVENMPVVKGRIGERRVTVLRDTGCNTVVVRKNLVPVGCYTGNCSPVYLLDRTVKYLPEAEIVINTPFLAGKVVAKCIDDPLYDLVLGNVPQVRDPNDPNPYWDSDQQRSEEIKTPTVQGVGHQLDKRAEVPERKDHKEASPYDSENTDLGLITPLSSTAGVGESRKNKSGNKAEPPLNVPQVPILETTVEELSTEQRNDASLRKCFDKVGKVVKKHKCRTKYEMVIKNNLLFRSCMFSTGRSIEQLALPAIFRPTVMAMAHDGIMSGHQGMKNTLALTAEEFFWPGMQSDIKRYVRSCDVCQRTVPKGRVGKAPLGTMPAIETPFKRVSIDIIGPINPTASSGNRYILTMVDVATRYPDAIPLRSIGTEKVAEALVEMFSRYGIPNEVLSDRGSCFTSDLMKEVSRLLSMKHLMTTPYHPMGNGLVERFNGTIKQMIRRMCQERPKDWDRYLPALLFAYREVPQASLKFSPFDLLYGRRVRGPLAILKEIWSNETLEDDVRTSYGHVLELRERLRRTCELAHRFLEEAKIKYKEHYDKKSVNPQLKEGDLALILLPSDHKLIMQWKGPFVVSCKKNEVDYELDVGGRKKVFHVNMLKRYQERVEVERRQPSCSAATQELGEATLAGEANKASTPDIVIAHDWKEVTVNDDLDDDEKYEVWRLIEQYKSIFSDLPGQTNLITCDLKLTTEEPVREQDFHIEYIKGKDNVGADFLSRLES